MDVISTLLALQARPSRTRDHRLWDPSQPALLLGQPSISPQCSATGPMCDRRSLGWQTLRGRGQPSRTSFLPVRPFGQHTTGSDPSTSSGRCSHRAGIRPVPANRSLTQSLCPSPLLCPRVKLYQSRLPRARCCRPLLCFSATPADNHHIQFTIRAPTSPASRNRIPLPPAISPSALRHLAKSYRV